MRLFLRFGNYLVLFLILILTVISFYKTGLYDKIFKKSSTIEIIKSDIDKDNDGIDDYSDILKGLKSLLKVNQSIKVNIIMEGILQMNIECVLI